LEQDVTVWTGESPRHHVVLVADGFFKYEPRTED